MSEQVTDNPARGRFELAVDGQVAFARYRRQDGVLAIDHVEAPPRLRGTGAADRLMHGVMALARAGGLKVLPRCGYAALWLRRKKDYADLLA